MHLGYKLRCFFMRKIAFMQNSKEGGSILCTKKLQDHVIDCLHRTHDGIYSEKEKEGTWQLLRVLK